MNEEPYLTPSIFPEEEKSDDHIPYENEGIEIPKVKPLNAGAVLANVREQQKARNAARAKEEMDRIATRLAEPPAASVPAGSASGEKATVPEGSPSGVNYWYVTLAILAFIGNVIFFLPLCILGLFGLSKHPFLGYFMFRDIFRKS